jgi:hypothetical protein
MPWSAIIDADNARTLCLDVAAILVLNVVRLHQQTPTTKAKQHPFAVLGQHPRHPPEPRAGDETTGEIKIHEVSKGEPPGKRARKERSGLRRGSLCLPAARLGPCPWPLRLRIEPPLNQDPQCSGEGRSFPDPGVAVHPLLYPPGCLRQDFDGRCLVPMSAAPHQVSTTGEYSSPRSPNWLATAF